MAQDSTDLPLYRRLRNARRARGLTQTALAAQVGCKQSALSMMESGRMEALARGTIEKIAEVLEIPLESDTRKDGGDAVTSTPSGRAICPSGDCPSNVPFVVSGEPLFWPRRQPTPAGRHCAFCGEVLVRNCRQCDTPITEGACCPQCGSAHVQPPPAAETGDVAAWAEQRRQQLAEWRALLNET